MAEFSVQGDSAELKQEADMIPSDPIMLLSFVNVKLRDYYSSLDALCEDLDVSGTEIQEKLETAGYHYDAERNQFI